MQYHTRYDAWVIVRMNCTAHFMEATRYFGDDVCAALVRALASSRHGCLDSRLVTSRSFERIRVIGPLDSAPDHRRDISRGNIIIVVVIVSWPRRSPRGARDTGGGWRWNDRPLGGDAVRGAECKTAVADAAVTRARERRMDDKLDHPPRRLGCMANAADKPGKVISLRTGQVEREMHIENQRRGRLAAVRISDSPEKICARQLRGLGRAEIQRAPVRNAADSPLDQYMLGCTDRWRARDRRRRRRCSTHSDMSCISRAPSHVVCIYVCFWFDRWCGPARTKYT